MKKITLLKILGSIILLFATVNSTYAICDTEEEKQTDFCRLYYSNITQVCNNEEYYKNTVSQTENTPIYTTEKYQTPQNYIDNPDAGIYWANKPEFFPLEMVKRKYREDQNNIYKCGVLQSQKASFELIIQLLQIDKTGVIKNAVKNKIKSKLSFVKKRIEKTGCNISKDLGVSKKQVLDQSTYEMCKYRYYLEYLKTYYKKIENIAPESIDELNNDKEEKIDVTYISNRQKKVLSEINEEIKHTYKVYDIAFNAYSEYQSFLPTHISLELIKQDFIVFRQKLYKTLSPISQVVYKIINAMTK